MQPMPIVSYVHWAVLAFGIVLLAQMIWLKLETRHISAVRRAVSRRIGFEEEAETFFTMETKSQLALHAACHRPIRDPSRGPRSSKVETPHPGQDRPARRLAMPVDAFVRDLNDLLRDQAGS